MPHPPANKSQKTWFLSAGVPFAIAFTIGIAIGAYEVNKDSGKTLSAMGREETFAEATVDCLQTGFLFGLPCGFIGIIGRSVTLLLQKKKKLSPLIDRRS